MKTALVVTTYNNPTYLRLCLKSLSAQTRRDFDLFIADDGSKPETAESIAAARALFVGQRVEHVWHPDEGYRKSTINNEVFRRLASYDVVICIDHDVIVHPKFVADHLSVHERTPNACFMGRRVELGPKVAASITEDNVVEFCARPSVALLVSGLRGDSQGVLRSFRIASPGLQKALKRDRVPDLLGSNFSLTRDLLYRVNGYNEDFQSYWGEDGDLFVRLRNIGANLVGLKGFAVQFHLHHKRLEPDAKSQMRYEELLLDRSYVRCKNGIEK